MGWHFMLAQMPSYCSGPVNFDVSHHQFTTATNVAFHRGSQTSHSNHSPASAPFECQFVGRRGHSRRSCKRPHTVGPAYHIELQLLRLTRNRGTAFQDSNNAFRFSHSSASLAVTQPVHFALACLGKRVSKRCRRNLPQRCGLRAANSDCSIHPSRRHVSCGWAQGAG